MPKQRRLYYPHKSASQRCFTCGKIHNSSQHRGHKYEGKSKVLPRMDKTLSKALDRIASRPAPKAPRAPKAAAKRKAPPKPKAAAKRKAPPKPKAAACGCPSPVAPVIRGPSGTGRRIYKRKSDPECIVGPGGNVYCQLPQVEAPQGTQATINPPTKPKRRKMRIAA